MITPEQFYTKKVQPLKKKDRIIERLVEAIEGDLEKARMYSKQWEECLKKREETKKKVEKEKNNAFIPCFAEKKVKEFEACVKCCRKTNACLLLKKQDVDLYEGRKKLFEQRLALVKDDLKQAEAFWVNFKKIRKNNNSLLSKIDESRLPDKAVGLLRHINCTSVSCADQKKRYSEKDLKDKADKLLLPDDKTKIFDKEKEGITFIQATRRIHKDFSIVTKLMGCEVNFVQQAIKRCELLREYDRKGSELLDVFKKKISSSSDLEERKFVFDVKLKEYEKAVSDAQGNYKKAMDLFAQIVKSPELNCSQKKCISIDNASCKRNKALKTDKVCYEKWNTKNDGIIHSQIDWIEGKEHCADPCPESQPADCSEENQAHQKAVRQCASHQDTEEEYREDMCCLDAWEASIPEYIWENLVRYEEARYLLSQIALIQYAVEEKYPVEEGKASAVKAGSSEESCMKMSKKDAMEDALHYWVTDFINLKSNHIDHFRQHAHDLLDKQVAYAQKNNAERIGVTIRGEANTFIGRDLYRIIKEMTRKWKYSDKESDGANEDQVIDPCELYGELSKCPPIDSTVDVSLCDVGPCTGDPPCCTTCCKEKETCKEEVTCCDDNRTYPCIQKPECPVWSLEEDTDDGTENTASDMADQSCGTPCDDPRCPANPT
jgi:hypothetical protein